ncbi:threonine aldolase [Pseudidiomarina salinarum]|uniref:Threonine aldolase n=1 Tax=Pseudidiomarina salinarum TaxID=435908 RepID=A0A094IYY2_9GAMM|nr:beta-eliminating lyase-related protein [Pseudidiomarina salinarum]KFZ31054.1 threonine aldolase [Pseudidiomarina salinarum]RUO71135.1 threonine aldolase [Pseudidiomarina salinarum]
MTDPIRQAYQEAARHARYSILRHPPESMATTLRRLADRAEAGDGPDYYGSGALIEDFEARMAAMLGKPAALFLPSGTLAQPMALKIHANNRDKQVIGLHPTSHMVLHEQNGYQQLWGLEGRLIGNKQQVLTCDDLQQQPQEDLAAVVLELPMREIGGQLPAWGDLQAQVNWARQHNIAVHIDGARLWHCPAYYQRSLAEIAGLADSVYVSLYKDIGGIAGAVLAGEADFIDEARIWNRRAGGNLIAFYPYILAAEQGLADNLPSIDEAVAYARHLGPLLGNVADVQVNPEAPQAAMFHLHIDRDPQVVIQAATGYAQQHGIVVLPLPRATENGRSVCEISVGRRTMEQPPEFWQQHLRACLATS